MGDGEVSAGCISAWQDREDARDPRL